MDNRILWGAAVIIIAAAAWYFFSNSAQTPAPVTNTPATYQWEMTDLGEHPSAPGVPRTGVVLLADGKRYPMGEFDGSCSEISGSSWKLLENEVSGVICWWAGGGSEVGIFKDATSTTVKIGTLDEGSAETPGFRGDFKTEVTL